MQLLLLGHRVDVDTSLLPRALVERLEHLWHPCAELAAGGADDGGGGSPAPGAPPGPAPGAPSGPAPGAQEPEITVRLLPPGHPARPGAHDLRLTDLATDETYAVSQHLTRTAIGLASGSLLLLHAAALAPQASPSPEAAPVVGIIAASGTGKTTFCRRLAGTFRYLTDETLAVDPATHAVLPYPKPLSVIAPDAAAEPACAQPAPRPGRKADHAPADLGLATPEAGAPAPRLAALVLARRVEDGNTLEPLGLAEALIEAIAQSSSLYRLAHPLLTLARALTLAGGPWRLSFSDQAQCAELLTALTTDPDVEPLSWQHLPGPGAAARDKGWGGAETTGATGATGTADAAGGGEEGDVPVTRLVPAPAPVLDAGTLLARAPWDDAVAAEGSIVLLYGRTPLVLSGSGAAAWTACETPRTLAQVHDAVVAALGQHPSSHRVVADTVTELVTRGVLTAGA